MCRPSSFRENRMKRHVSINVVIALVLTAALGAQQPVSSPVADAAMRGDKAGGKGEKSEMSPKGEKGDKSRGKKKEQ